MKRTSVLFICLSFYFCSFAQHNNEKKVTGKESVLYKKIAQLDSALFSAYNSKNLNLMKTYFTREYTLTRSLIKESLEVHPIEGYDAIEVGSHQFKHIENGKLEVGTFKFLMIWKSDNDNWKISRVISYDH